MSCRILRGHVVRLEVRTRSSCRRRGAAWDASDHLGLQNTGEADAVRAFSKLEVKDNELLRRRGGRAAFAAVVPARTCWSATRCGRCPGSDLAFGDPAWSCSPLRLCSVVSLLCPWGRGSSQDDPGSRRVLRPGRSSGPHYRPRKWGLSGLGLTLPWGQPRAGGWCWPQRLKEGLGPAPRSGAPRNM